jgi:hypothetical protein
MHKIEDLPTRFWQTERSRLLKIATVLYRPFERLHAIGPRSPGKGSTADPERTERRFDLVDNALALAARN